MNKIIGKLTVCFEEPFWIGLFERIENGEISVCRVTFGAEPKDCEVWELVLRNYYRLKFSPALKAELKQTPDNFKRRQRNVKKQLKAVGIGTKSQQALAAQREELKSERQKIGKEQKEAERQRRFSIKQQKRKEKHKGH